jgi:hypothetical protein
MSHDDDQDHSEGSLEGTINAVTELAKAVPIYQDAIQPVALETGRALQTVGKAVNVALSPIRGMIWGYEQIESFVYTTVSKKLEKVPVENIQTPDPAVAGPALESLKYTGHKETLRELYANLLASSMDKETAKNAHPGFVEIIRNLSSDEGELLSFVFKSGHDIPLIDIRKQSRNNKSGSIIGGGSMSIICNDAGCEHCDLSQSYIINLERLGLISIDKERELFDQNGYTRILEIKNIKNLIKALDNDSEYQANIRKYYAELTPFGRQFAKACIMSKNEINGVRLD